jgi:NAD(P)-dependent dehydrogenase (short-subunit alcohol dehydrogenase family)
MTSNFFTSTKSHLDLFSLSGKTAAVIGGGGHVCSALAKGLASAGANVAIIDLRVEKAEKIAREIGIEYGVKTLGLYADATNLSELNSMMKILLQFSDKIDVAVNGGGINSPEPFLEIDESDWHRVVD